MGVITRAKRSGVNGDGEEICRVPLLGVSAEESLASPIDRRSALYRSKALAILAEHGGLGAPQPLLTPPNVLTFLRILLVPAFVACWYGAHRHYSVATAALFILASVTDWLDGWMARRMKLTSAFGAFLDPVADKIMVSTALVLLATAPPPPVPQPAMVVPVVLIISREITMSALREWAAASGGAVHEAVKVSSLGKWKTALQMTAMSFLLALRNDHLVGDSPTALAWVHSGTLAAWGTLVASTALALWSLAAYMSNVWHFFRYPDAHKHS